jgi:hypothetical protein
MCNTAVASSIIETLDRMRADEEVFTAYDVTKETRQSVDDNVRHNDVRSIVEQEFQTGGLVGYSRELRTLDLPSAPQANVYFPYGKSAEDHSLVAEDWDGADGPDDADDTDDGDDTITATAEGRINIPKKLLDQITPVNGAYDLSFGGTLFPRTANKDGRVRVSLSDLGISSNKVKITVDNDVLQVESI